MHKSLTTTFQLFAAGMMLLGLAPAQTPAATSSQPAASQAAPASSSQSAPATASKPKSTTTSTTAKKAPVTTKSATPLALKTPKEKASYGLGMNIGSTLKRQGVQGHIDPAIVARGLRDALNGTKPALTDEEIRAALTMLQTEVRGEQELKAKAAEAKAHEAGAPNRKAGEEFLAANKTKDGVVTLPSGLQYKILTAGSGAKPTASDMVTCNYRGTLLNGTEFDASEKHGGAQTFPLGRVIKGWTEALQLMPVGSKWQLFIPPDLAYGDGAPPEIGPGSTLIFDVELVSIGEPKKDQPKQDAPKQ
jgi:FKBP-type peptidyl-prolyl cis-trans isomerase